MLLHVLCISLFPGSFQGSTMEIARSLFGPRAPQGYTDGSTQGQVHTAADDEDTDDVFLPDTPEGLSTGEGNFLWNIPTHLGQCNAVISFH